MKATQTPLFEKSLKTLLKKYKLAQQDVINLIEAVEKNPLIGEVIPSFDNLIFKTRGSLKAYRIGKRGGLRLIYLFNKTLLILIYIYSKRKMQNPPLDELRAWLKENGYVPTA